MMQRQGGARSGRDCFRIWVRERLSGGSAEMVHCHMLFHLAHPFFSRQEVDRREVAITSGVSLKLTFPRNPNGVYLLKGGGPEVWRRFGMPRFWRKPQGLIFGQALRYHSEYSTPAARLGGAPRCAPTRR
jgi:hypothetical protein